MFALINFFNTVFIIGGAIVAVMMVLAVIGIIRKIVIAIIRQIKRHRKSK